MILDRTIKIQLALFTVIALAAGGVMIFQYINAPALLFGVGHYTVTLELPRAAGLYPNANVTYRGTEVGQVKSVQLTDTGVTAQLLLRSGIKIPSPLHAEVHSQSAIGEQYVALLPDSGARAALKNGDVIPQTDTSVPPDIDLLLDATNRGLAAIPKNNLRTVIDESYTAVAGLGPELSRLVKGSTELAIDADRHVDSLTTLIDQSKPVLDSQADTADQIKAWAAHLANVTGQLRSADTALGGVLHTGGPALDESRQLVERLRPTLPLLLANLVSVGDVALRYQPALEQLLVLFPQAVANLQGAIMANLNTKQDYLGLFLDFTLNFNLPPICNTGFLPPQQQRVPASVDSPDRPPGELYCRVPQDSPFAVRGARNYPCLTVPGKRAPTVKMCESDQQYVPLNDGYSWKGDPNATFSGQDVPQLPPDSHPPEPAPPQASVPPIAAAQYDPATGGYVGPDGRLYNQSDLSRTAPPGRSWQSMVIPGGGS
ncbi:MlaD family protein [Mycobacterium intracellulare]|uniref:MlaD family protein n=1 Tax=Mycobacterium intracellulare TaxID=1767 RepID=UPI00335DA96D